MTLDGLSTVASLIAIAASMVSVYVVLYVKATFAPIAEQIQAVRDDMRQQREALSEVFDITRDTGQRLSRLEGEHARNHRNHKGGN